MKLEEKKSQSEQIKVWDTVKAAILMYGVGVPCLIASIVNNTKPVHYLLMVSRRIELLEMKKKAYNNIDSGQ